MKPYGIKHKYKGPCACEMCGANAKYSLKKRERFRAKEEIKSELQDTDRRRKERVNR